MLLLLELLLELLLLLLLLLLYVFYHVHIGECEHEYYNGNYGQKKMDERTDAQGTLPNRSYS